MSFGIYKIVNKVTGKEYVGSCVNFTKRVTRHLTYLRANNHHSKKLQNSYNKHGEDNFEFVFLSHATKENLLLLEKEWIDKLDTFKNGYNMSPTPGSRLGAKTSEETKKKMSLASLGKKKSPESVKKSIENRKPLSAEKMEAANEKRRRFRHTNEAKEKIRLSSTGRKHTAETKLKQSSVQRGKKRSEETKKMFRDMRGTEEYRAAQSKRCKERYFREYAGELCSKNANNT